MNRLSKLSTAVAATLVIFFALAFSGQAAAKVILYGVASGSGTGEQGSGGTGPGTGPGNFSQFHIIDLDTGVATEISMDIGFGGGISGLEINKDGVVFSARGGRGPNNLNRPEFPSLLFTIEPLNGLGGAAIGPMGIEFGPPDSAGFGPGDGDFDQFGSLRQNTSDMSFHPNGTLYGMAARGSQLFEVDTETGLATRIGTPCPPDAGLNATFCRRGNAIAFDAGGALFWANDFEIAELDPDTGLIVGPGTPLDFTPFGTPTDPDAGFRVVGMDFHPLTGDLYASVLQRQFQDSPPARATLAILDPWTGTFDIIGQVDGTGVKLEGIAFTAAPDHFRCYAVHNASARDDFSVSLEDQFRSDPAVEVRRVVSICAPVDKDGEGIVDPDTHLVCYQIGRSGALEIDATVSNQFGNDQELTVLNERTLCVPSSKEIID